MKKEFTSLLLSAAMLAAAFPAAAEESNMCGDNLTWELNGGTLTISGSGAMYDWSVLKKAPWYSQRESIINVNIQDGVESIGAAAFENCVNLGSDTMPVVIPESVKSIGGSAFDGCGKMTDIYVPNSVESIGTRAFAYCVSLKNIELPNIKEISDYTFCYDTGLSSVTIPNGIERIGNSAFSQCTGLLEITVPESVSEIGDGAFNQCTSLKNVDYIGSRDEWGGIAAGRYNGGLNEAELYCVKPYSVLINTVPYSRAEIDGTEYYSDAAGKIRVDNSSKAEDYSLNYSIEKKNYKSVSAEQQITADGAGINAVLEKDGDVLYSESFDTAEGKSRDLKKGEKANDLFGITAYAAMNVSTENNMLTIENNAKSGFYSAVYPLDVKAVDSEINFNAVFPKNSESHIVIRDAANQVIAAIYRDKEGNAYFSAQGENFSKTNMPMENKSGSLGVIEGGVSVPISINADITGGKIIAKAGNAIAGVSSYEKKLSGYDTVSSVMLGTEAGSSISIDDILIEENRGTEAKMAKLTLETLPYAKAVINNTVYYSGKSGVIELEYALANENSSYPISYTVEKGGYITANGAVSGTADGAEINAQLEPEADILYAEDFENLSSSVLSSTLLGGNTDEIFGITAKYGTIDVTADKNLSMYNSGNGFRSASFPLNINSKDSEVSMKLTLPKSDVHIILRDSENQSLAVLNQSSDGTLTFGASGTAFDTANSCIGGQNYSLGSVEPGTEFTLNVKIDVTNKKITASVGDETAVVHNYKKSKDADNISSIFIGLGRGSELSIDDIRVKKYVGEPDTLSMLTLRTTPYAKAVINGQTMYSGASGVIETGYSIDSGDETDITYTIEKGGYKSISGNEKMPAEGLEINAQLEPEDNIIYAEDFGSVAVSSVNQVLDAKQTADSLFGIYAEYGTITLKAEKQMLSIYNGGGGFRSVSYPLNVNKTDYEIAANINLPSGDASHYIVRDSKNNVIAALFIDAEGNVTLGASGSYNKANAAIGVQEQSVGKIEQGKLETIKLQVNSKDKTVTAILGDSKATAAASNLSAPASIYIGTGRGKTIVLDSIIIRDTNEAAPTPTVKPTAAPDVTPTVKPTIKPTAAPDVTPTATPEVKSEVGNPVYSNSTVTIPVKAVNGDKLDINIYAAEYGADGRLIGIKTVLETVSDSKNITFEYVKKSSENRLVICVWDNEMKPYVNPAVN